MKPIRNIFISHAGDDEPSMQKLKEMISPKYESIRDSSMYESGDKHNNASNEDYIKSLLRGAIDWAGTVVVLVSDKTAGKDWIDYEVEYAAKENKNIVGVWLPGSQENDLPDSLRNYATSTVSWDAEKIYNAIEGKQIVESPTSGHIRLNEVSRDVC